MKILFRFLLSVSLLSAFVFAGSIVWAAGEVEKKPEFEAGITIEIDGENYYFAGPVVGPNGERDVPGHDWVQIYDSLVYGRHFNTGPMGKAKWWSSDAPDGALLFTVIGVIDTWSESKAEEYALRGFVHYHEFVNTDTGEENQTKVVWLKHAAVRNFNFDGGPNPGMGHEVSRGIDLKFIPNYKKPYMS